MRGDQGPLNFKHEESRLCVHLHDGTEDFQVPLSLGRVRGTLQMSPSPNREMDVSTSPLVALWPLCLLPPSLKMTSAKPSRGHLPREDHLHPGSGSRTEQGELRALESETWVQMLPSPV